VLLQGFLQSLPVCWVLVSAGIDNIPDGLGGAMRTYLAFVRARCTPRRVAVRRAPEPGPVRGDRDGLFDLFSYIPSSSLRGMEDEVSATPIERVANYGFLIELLSGDSSGRPCPI
jgi:hypothetical protein